MAEPTQSRFESIVGEALSDAIFAQELEAPARNCRKVMSLEERRTLKMRSITIKI